MKKNVCIVHYNTPVLTAHLVKSINKYTPDTNIYIFDNSDKLPFKNSFANVTVFDNTKGQYINFQSWLKKYPNKDKSGGRKNNWGSAKHAYSIEKCMELIGEPFVLFDSDVLVKKDFTPLFDEIVCYKGEVIYQPGTGNKIKRVLPFICFINTPMCKEKNIHYFDERYMHGLQVGPTGDRYDTGAALYILTEKCKAPHREIKVSDYIVHYGNGSWVDAAEKLRKPKHIPAGDWLRKYKEFWYTGEDTDIKTSFDTVFDHIYCLHYLPAADRLTKIKKEFEAVGIDASSEYFSWVYDYPSSLLDTVYTNKNLKMDTALKATTREYIKRVSMKHYQIVKEAYSLGYERILIMENDVRFHRDLSYIDKMLKNIPDTDIVMFDKMTCSGPRENIKYKEYIKTLPDGALYGNMNESGVFFIFCSCYALNRNAMERIIKLHEEKLLPPDTPLNDKQLTGSFAIINVAIQDPKLKTRKIETYDKIGLDTSVYGVVEPEKPSVKPTPKATVKQPEKKIPVVKRAAQPTKVQAVQPPVKKKEPIKPQTLTQVKRPANKRLLPDKAIRTRSRIIQPSVVGHNKLYDVY